MTRLHHPTLSVIVPVGPGDSCTSKLIESLSVLSGEMSLVVSAAGPRPEDFQQYNLMWLEGPPGRGAQLNRARAATGSNWLWIVHSDCRVDASTIEAVKQFIGRETPALGYCRLRFLRDGPWLAHLNAIGANLRSRLFRLPYGDQGLCVPASWLDRLGGFREDLQRGEDLDLVVRAREAGLQIRPIDATIHTSARRYRENGWLRTTWQHQLAARRLIRNARRQTTPPGP